MRFQRISPWIAALTCLIPDLFFMSCSHQEKPLFNAIPPEKSGIGFVNKVEDSDSLSILDYMYYYNGAGVAIGDINNDGLPDIFLVSNTHGNKLYLNKGNMQFEDITEKAGVSGQNDWSTGVTMADVNGDGYLDIFVSAVSNHEPDRDSISHAHVFFKDSRNKLFINNGDGTFTEEAKKWGLDIPGYNTQAVFFDYDNDGDLDMFLLQHSVHQTATYGDTSGRKIYSPVSGGKLYRNDGDHFTEVTREAGIISSPLGYGLGIAVADFNHDGLEDIYVSNDFNEDDYYYMNLGNGRFREMNRTAFGHESKFSMGNDVADINNDGWPDIISLDMLPADEKTLKSSQREYNLNIYNYLNKIGFNYQYSKNCLQLNTGKGFRYSDISLYSGVAATDWSWSPLIADFNLDGINDLFVSNGIKTRQNNLDFIDFYSGLNIKNKLSQGVRSLDRQVLEHAPSGAWHSYIFEGSPDLKFIDRSTEWGFGQPSLSQGAAYGDLDGDGAIDLVVNKMNEPAGLFHNQARELFPGRGFLSVKLKGPGKNTSGIGAKIFLYSGGRLQYRELQSVHGFMSSSEPVFHFGLGDLSSDSSRIDSLVLIWPNRRYQKFYRLNPNQTLSVTYLQGKTDSIFDYSNFIQELVHTPPDAYFKDITGQSGIDYKHQEDLSFVDFNYQPFIPHELSTQGPKLAVADVNGDGLEDFFVCGAMGHPGALFLQQANGSFLRSPDSLAFVKDRLCEEVDALFFDANGDGYPDLYVASGGNEYPNSSAELNDRLYINDGKGHFTRSDGLPGLPGNKSVVRVADFDHDGSLDIFVGGRADAKYGNPTLSFLLRNDGKGHFNICTEAVIPGLSTIGMVTGAAWADFDGNGWPDLLITGEWMKPVLYLNDHGKFHPVELTDDDESLRGWWFGLQVTDLNGDGKPDILLGNYGLNSKLTASRDFPLKMYLAANLSAMHTANQILAVAKDGKYYPFLTKEDLERQIPSLKNEYLGYEKMAGKTVEEIFGDKLQNANVMVANTLASTILLNDGKGHFKASPLPFPLQWSPIFTFDAYDFNGDGKTDILSGGNFFGIDPYEGRYDAMPLAISLGDGKGGFSTLIQHSGALLTQGEVRDIKPILVAGQRCLLVARNNDRLLLFQIDHH